MTLSELKAAILFSGDWQGITEIPPAPAAFTILSKKQVLALIAVAEAANKVAAYLTIEAEFSGDEAEHSGLYELDAALGTLIAQEML